MAIIVPGDQIKVDFKNIVDDDGVPFDPPTVKFHYKAPGQPIVTVTHPDASTTKIQAGWYQVIINVPYARTAIGAWFVDAQGLDGSAVSLIVESSKFEVVSNGLFLE
jgi:hypothetical protein